MSFEMSAFHCLEVGRWNWVWNILVVLLMLLRLFIIAVLLHSSSLATLGIALSVEALVVLETSSSSWLHGATSLAHSVLSEITSATSHVTALATGTTSILLHSWRLFTVLILNTLQGKSKLLWGQWISRLSQFFVTMGEMAFLSKVAVLMGFIMSASLSLVLLVDVVILLGSHLKLGVELVHLTSHHWLIGHLSGRVWHHTHHLHLWVHLVLLDILLVGHLLHVHLLHWLHARGHLVLGH